MIFRRSLPLAGIILCLSAGALQAQVPGADAPYNVKIDTLTDARTRCSCRTATRSGMTGRSWPRSGSQPMTRGDMPFVIQEAGKPAKAQGFAPDRPRPQQQRRGKEPHRDERESIRKIVKDNWWLFPLKARRNLRSYFSLQELEAMDLVPLPQSDLDEPALKDQEGVVEPAPAVRRRSRFRRLLRLSLRRSLPLPWLPPAAVPPPAAPVVPPAGLPLSLRWSLLQPWLRRRLRRLLPRRSASGGGSLCPASGRCSSRGSARGCAASGRAGRAFRRRAPSVPPVVAAPAAAVPPAVPPRTRSCLRRRRRLPRGAPSRLWWRCRPRPSRSSWRKLLTAVRSRLFCGLSRRKPRSRATASSTTSWRPCPRSSSIRSGQGDGPTAGSLADRTAPLPSRSTTAWC